MSLADIRPNADMKLRTEVAAATRIMVMENLIDYSGHVSARVPGEDAYYIQPAADPRSDLVPERMIKVDFEGNVISGAPLRPPFEIPIHGEIYKARPDVNAVVHCHMELAIWFTMMKDVQLQLMRARAARWQSGIPTDDDPSHIKTKEQGAKLARALGPHHACLMRGHGLVMVAESVPALLVDAVHFDENARAHMQVLQAGQAPAPLTETELDLVNKSEMREFHVDKLWTYYVRKAEKSAAVPREWECV